MLWATPPSPPPIGPPPLAFRSATLDRQARTIDVDLMAVATVEVQVVVSRNGVDLGKKGGDMDRGGTVVSVPIGKKGLKPLRKGLHVDVRISFGANAPLRVHTALLLAPPTADDDQGLTA